MTIVKISVGRIGLVAVTAVLASALVACGQSEAVDDTGAAATGDGSTNYPLVLDNCGKTVTVDAPPQRVVSLDQGSTEIMLSLGLADRMVGTASWTDPVRDNLAEANASVPRLADNAPTYEVVLDADPDFVTASFGRHFKQGGVAERARFDETGVESYLSPTDCENGVSINGGGKRTTPLTMDALYQEIRELAAVFDMNERGARLVDELQGREAAAIAGIEKSNVSMAFWFADTKSPYAAGVWARRTCSPPPSAPRTCSLTSPTIGRRSVGKPLWNETRRSSFSVTCCATVSLETCWRTRSLSSNPIR